MFSQDYKTLETVTFLIEAGDNNIETQIQINITITIQTPGNVICFSYWC